MPVPDGLRNLGGTEVISTGEEDLRARLQELTAGKGVEHAIDCITGELGAEVARNLAPAGTMLVYGALSSHRQTDPASTGRYSFKDFQEAVRLADGEAGQEKILLDFSEKAA